MRKRRKEQKGPSAEDQARLEQIVQTMRANLSDEYIVVCSEGHISMGPLSAQRAVSEAQRLTQAGRCEYFPVPFVSVRQAAQETTDDERGTGQYL